MKVQADGNIIGTTPVAIDLIPNRLQIIVPAVNLTEVCSSSGEVSNANGALREASI